MENLLPTGFGFTPDPILISWLQAAFLGIIEGLTEFLPVSSTGHLILFIDLLNFAAPPGKVFEVVIQVGAILAVIAIFLRKLWWLATSWPVSASARHQLLTLIIAFVPAAALGVALHDYIKTVLFSPLVVAVALIVGGIAMLLIERYKQKIDTRTMDAISLKDALWIGLGQCLALIPGVSRAGATIMTALAIGIERKVATEFSFLLSVPILVGAAGYDLYKNHAALLGADLILIGIGFVTAFLSALLVAKTLIGFVSRRGFAPFAWYRIILGSVFLVLLASQA